MPENLGSERLKINTILPLKKRVAEKLKPEKLVGLTDTQVTAFKRIPSSSGTVSFIKKEQAFLKNYLPSSGGIRTIRRTHIT